MKRSKPDDRPHFVRKILSHPLALRMNLDGFPLVYVCWKHSVVGFKALSHQDKWSKRWKFVSLLKYFRRRPRCRLNICPWMHVPQPQAKRKILKRMLKFMNEFRDLEPVSFTIENWFHGHLYGSPYESIFRDPREEE